MMEKTALVLFLAGIFLIGVSAAYFLGSRSVEPAVQVVAEEQGTEIFTRTSTKFRDDRYLDPIYSQLNEFEDVAVLDAALTRIFGQADAIPKTEETVLAVLRYVPQVTELRYLYTRAGSDCLTHGEGYCSAMAMAFASLCRRVGMPACVNALHNFEIVQAHNTAEVYYDGAWHFFDPTYGTFFYDRAPYDGSGRVLSLKEIVQTGALPEHGFSVVSTELLWTGKYDPTETLSALPTEFKYGHYKNTLGEFYERVFSSAFPILYSEVAAGVFPLDVDLRSVDSVQLGGERNPAGVFARKSDGQYVRYGGLQYLGESPFGGGVGLVTIKGNEPSRYRFTCRVSNRTSGTSIQAVPLKDVVFGRVERQTDRWSAIVRVLDAEGSFLLFSSERNVVFGAIDVVRIDTVE